MKNYNTIVKPLKKMAEELKVYMGRMSQKVIKLGAQKKVIDNSIHIAEKEIKKSANTRNKLERFLDTDS